MRDAQYLMRRLADDGVIDAQRIGAAGGSYGGGMAIGSTDPLRTGTYAKTLTFTLSTTNP